jgi:hypothetical protein
VCHRTDDDPLVRILTERYKLNILRLPRPGIGVGELLIREGKDLKCSGRITKLFDPELEIQEDGPVPLPDLGGVTTAHLSATVAAAPLAGLLAALGAVGVSSIDARLRRAHDVSVVFGITGAQYRTTDLVTLGDELASRVVRHGNALYRAGREFYVANAAAQAAGIKIAFSASSERAARLALEIEQLIKAESSMGVARDESGYLVLSRPEPVTFGLAVIQLVPDGSSLRFEATDRLRAVRGKEAKPGTTDGEIPNILFGGSSGEVLVEIG